jgi:hypothetical protein
MFVIIAEHFDSLDLIRTRIPNSCAQNGMPALVCAAFALAAAAAAQICKNKKSAKIQKKKGIFSFHDSFGIS